MVKFDHTQKNLQAALDIDDQRSDELDALVLYSILNQSFMMQKLFDNPKDAPANMRTKTGVLERCFESAKNEQERIYLTWEYCRIDSNSDSKKLMMLLSGLAMMYEAIGGDEDKFIQMFAEKKAEARRAHLNGELDGPDDDE